MSELVTIIHPVTGGTAEVPRVSLPHHYRSGWRVLTDEEQPQPEEQPDPPALTRAQAAKAKSKTESEGK